jgi:hypothetical protein
MRMGLLVYAPPVILGVLIATNIAQNGPANHPVPAISGPSQAMALSSKADFIAAWRNGKAPGFAGLEFDGDLPPLGALAPFSAFISHQLFGGIGGGPWLGKSFPSDIYGINRFASGDKVTFTTSIGPSRYDGKPALLLNYREGNSFVWGKLMGMHDELREVAPGVLLGIGGMTLSGGIQNSAPFVLWRKQ